MIGDGNEVSRSNGTISPDPNDGHDHPTMTRFTLDPVAEHVPERVEGGAHEAAVLIPVVEQLSVNEPGRIDPASDRSGSDGGNWEPARGETESDRTEWERESPHLILTKRAEHLGEHPGQMSFPGGGREPVDESIRETALREANEEIGLRASETAVIGRLDDIRTVTEYAVSPFVARVPDRRFERNDAEVAEIVAVPVSAFVDPANYEYEHRSHPHYGEIVVHYFHVGGYTVWGATARILVQFLALSMDWRPPLEAEGLEG